MVSRQGQNAGFVAFCQHSGNLLRAIQDPLALAWRLYSTKLISREVRLQACESTLPVQERVSNLLGVLMKTIDNNEAAFDTFLSVLSRDPVMKNMVQKLKDARGTYMYLL